MGGRAAALRRRRSKNLRYRAPRFLNRTNPRGWLAPSLQSRSDNILSWTERYRRLLPITALGVERVRFDLQALQHPGIAGVEYQQGDLAGYEVREYLLEKWGRKCAYCGAVNTPLEVEHIVPKARGGSNRSSNLTLACRPCNQAKGAQPLEKFAAPAVAARIKRRMKAPLNHAAAINATRNSVFFGLRRTGLPVEAGSGGMTKWNRSKLGVPKSHCLDAACVGDVRTLTGWHQPVLSIKALGRGTYKRTQLDRYGFPRGYLMRQKTVRGFQTGDIIRAVVPSGKKTGIHIGRVAVRASGSFNITTPTGVVQGINAKYCTLISRADGYGYQQERRTFLPALKDGVSGAVSR